MPMSSQRRRRRLLQQRHRSFVSRTRERGAQRAALRLSCCSSAAPNAHNRTVLTTQCALPSGRASLSQRQPLRHRQSPSSDARAVHSSPRRRLSSATLPKPRRRRGSSTRSLLRASVQPSTSRLRWTTLPFPLRRTACTSAGAFVNSARCAPFF